MNGATHVRFIEKKRTALWCFTLPRMHGETGLLLQIYNTAQFDSATMAVTY